MKFALMGIVTVVVCFIINKMLGAIVLAAALFFTIYSLVPNFYAVKGNKAFAAGNEEDALKWYKKAVETKRANLTIRTSYAFILLRTGHPEEAETVLNEILINKSVPDEKKNAAKQNRCMVYYKLGRLDEAVEEAEELFETYRNTTVYGMLGYFKILKGGDWNEILNFCLEAYDYNSDDRDILDNLSIVYYKLGQYDKARAISEELIKTAPKFVEAYYHAAQICEKCGEVDKGLEFLENIEDCRRTYLTTVSEDEIEKLRDSLKKRK